MQLPKRWKLRKAKFLYRELKQEPRASNQGLGPWDGGPCPREDHDDAQYLGGPRSLAQSDGRVTGPRKLRGCLQRQGTPRACLERWPVGSATLPGAHFRVWPPFLLPRPGPLEAKPPPPPGSSRTPFSTVARGLGSARCWAGDFGALCAGGRWPWRAHAGEGKVPPALLRREIHGL
jgi:hypothetical protein